MDFKKLSSVNISFSKKVTSKEVVSFTRELATLTGAGLSLVKSLNSLRDQMKPGTFRESLSDVVESVERGDAFSEALERFPKIFPKVYVNMIRSGEMSGSLDEILSRLALLLEKQQKLVKKVKSALIYPCFVLGLAFVILSLLMIFVIPTFTEMFDEMGGQLPKPTLFLIGVSNAFKNYWYLILAGIFGLVWIFKYSLRYPVIKFAFDKMSLYFPVFGQLISRVTIARFARTLGTLLNSDVPILSALQVVRETTNNSVYADCIPLIAEAVKEGDGLSGVMEETKLFPNLVIKMVGVGEESGQLSEMLVKVADNYDEDVDNLVASMSALMEPFLIVFMGLIVGFIVIAMFLPLFNLSDLL